MKINGRAIAKKISEELIQKTEELTKKGITPHLLIILVGNDLSSKAYIRQKIKRAEKVGIRTTLKRYPKNTSEKTLLKFVKEANTDTSVHGIIIQRPLPSQFDPLEINHAVIPEKDVDGFHPQSKFDPPLALAVIRILEEIHPKVSAAPLHQWLNEKNIVILGRGEAGGKPVITYLNKLGIPHQVIHSQTSDRNELLKTADIIISAVGKREVVKKDWLKKGVILIGIGLHKENNSLFGDYVEDDIKDIASCYTPTPGGVGPVNVIMLLKNITIAANR